MKRFVSTLVALVLVSSTAGAAEAPKDPPVFTIGAILAMTGQSNYIGQVMSQGFGAQSAPISPLTASLPSCDPLLDPGP